MTNSTSHAGGRSARYEPPAARAPFGVDLGHEPPLGAGGAEAADVDRREVNLRWLGASVLTGITGGVLIGASIYIALEGAAIVAAPPEKAVAGAVRVPVAERPTTATRKGDKLNRSEIIVSAKQGFRAPVTIRVGDREVIKQRQFVRLATNLSLAAGTYATDIPRFNPLRLFAEENGERYVEPPPEVADADVSVVKRDLASLTVEANAPSLSDEDVIATLDEERRLLAEAGRRPAVPFPAQQMLTRTLRQPASIGEALGYAGITSSPFNTIEVRVVPENVTNLSRSEVRGTEPLVEERDAVLRKGETLETVLRAHGAESDQIRFIMTALSARVRVSALPEGQRMRILIAPGPRPGDRRQIVRVILFGERGIESIAAVNDRGQFVSVTPPADDTQRGGARSDAEDGEDESDEEGGVGLYESLYETALKNELPRQTVDELVRIFGFDVDFQRRVAPGDSFEVFYGLDEDNGTPELLYAALTVGGEPRQVYRYQGEDGTVDFFDDQGRSLKRFLVRKPIAEGLLRSGFGYRRHPILGYSKMHTGVDWANRIGTPIVAAGNGTVIKAEWDSGYGRRIEVQHNNGYVTAYSHLSRFGGGIAPGARVRQGQVIGYLGNTGLSTGPHLHYEVIVNGHFVDPMKIRLPRGRELDGRALAEFRRQREQVDALMARAGSSTRLAQRTELR